MSTKSLSSARSYRRWITAAALIAAQIIPVHAMLVPNEVAVANPPDELAEIVVETQEPRFVAPTRRDRIGRIWAPVFINGKGPFRMVLDTGASHSAVNAQVAADLGISLDSGAGVMLRGVTGSARVPTIRVDSLNFGDLLIEPVTLPIVADALGGADGVLGYEGLSDKRIVIDFAHDRIRISSSRNERARFGFITVPIRLLHGQLLVVDATVGEIHVKAIIDTGGQATIANLALRKALDRHNHDTYSNEQITGATLDTQSGKARLTPPIHFGAMQISGARVTFGDMHIFEHWSLTREPAMLIGMDALGLLDTLIIDYKRRELQIRTSNRSG